ncbi:hypothetical protein, partial [Aurantimicrobium sp.]|uniref:hypothetical protein n=1 Tax=Aurantimicrobium sp. TaxID=1930784 RepID=UPI002FCBD2E3
MMAASFRLQHKGKALTVPRKFLLTGKSLAFVRPEPVQDDSGVRTPRYWPRQLPHSAFELENFEHLKNDFELASQECNTLRLRVSIPSHPEVKTIEDLRAHALNVGTATSSARKYDELSEKLLGLKHAQLVAKLRNQTAEKFRKIFDDVLLVDPREPGRRGFVYGTEVEADKHIKEAFYTLAEQGHVYSQFIGGLLATPFGKPLSAKSAELLVQAHINGFPMALAALGERLLAESYFFDALQCVIMALEGGYKDAGSILDDLHKNTFATLLETPQGLVPFLPYLVKVELSEDMRNLLYKHKPAWGPLTPEQQAEDFFAR